MLAEFVQKLIDIHVPDKEIYKTDDGREFVYSSNQQRLIPLNREEDYHTLSSVTLTGIIDWLKSSDYKQDAIIRVKSYDSIKVVSPSMSPWHQRKIYITAEPIDRKHFPFGEYMPLEAFIIKAQTLFVNTEEKQQRLRYLSSINSVNVLTSDDDGISQTVTVKKQVIGQNEKGQDKAGRLIPVQLDPIVWLKPYRTFTEVSQPASPYLMRLKQNDGAHPNVALFEAGGSEWKNEAIQSIKKFFIENETVKELGVDVIG